ncbi:MAG: response regulator transcription factor [Candidatus Spechtbacterales bacterium]|nr:response regulator transcription factor [Candidatus Spechtbacterales bacterium]
MRILVIEDEKKLAQTLKKGLEKDGHAVDYVLDGQSGFQRIKLYESEYDLVILDLMLPEKSGEEVCKEVREEGIKIPILILSAKGMVENKIELLDMGADDYLVKPFSFDELKARVNALLRRPEESIPTKLQVKNITLNPAKRKAYINDEEVHLTLKEFVLLEYLMRSKGRVLTREQIHDHLWDFANDSFSNVVDVHIKNLRKKIDDDSQDPKILETVRGVGYRIKEE